LTDIRMMRLNYCLYELLPCTRSIARWRLLRFEETRIHLNVDVFIAIKWFSHKNWNLCI